MADLTQSVLLVILALQVLNLSLKVRKLEKNLK